MSALSRTASSTSGCPARSEAMESSWWEAALASVGLVVVTPTSSRPLPLMTLDRGLWFFGTCCGTLQMAPAPRRVKWFKS